MIYSSVVRYYNIVQKNNGCALDNTIVLNNYSTDCWELLPVWSINMSIGTYIK